MRNDGHQIHSASDALKFILAGRATVTIVSKKTGTRFTYKVKAKKDADEFDPRFVSLMTGPDNERSYKFMATIFSRNNLRWSAKSKVSRSHKGAMAFEWLFGMLRQNIMPSSVEVWHSGKCGKCGRKLTVPLSIRTGIGPICDGRILGDVNPEDEMHRIEAEGDRAQTIRDETNKMLARAAMERR